MCSSPPPPNTLDVISVGAPGWGVSAAGSPTSLLFPFILVSRAEVAGPLAAVPDRSFVTHR
jgi:hypothetical protein